MTRAINKEVTVNSYYFAGGKRCFPKRVELEGRELDFETGLRCLVQTGQQIVQIFTMSDGTRQYRLSFEPHQRTWKLLTMQSL